MGSTDWFDATGVDFASPWIVTQSSGNYAGLNGQSANFTDFGWGAGSGAVSVPLAQNIWTFTVAGITYSLNVGTVTNIDRGTSVNDNISVVGVGTLTITGFDPTPGTWSFTGGFAGTSQNLSFSASPTPVPEPSTLAMLALGLLGLVAVSASSHLNIVGT